MPVDHCQLSWGVLFAHLRRAVMVLLHIRTITTGLFVLGRGHYAAVEAINKYPGTTVPGLSCLNMTT